RQVVHICPHLFSTGSGAGLAALRHALSHFVDSVPHALSTCNTTTYGKLCYCVSIRDFLGCPSRRRSLLNRASPPVSGRIPCISSPAPAQRRLSKRRRKRRS